MKRLSLGIKIMIFTFFTVIITSAVLITFSFRSAYTDLEDTIGMRLEAIASTGALMIDGDLHDQIRGPEDADGEAFHILREKLRAIQSANDLDTEIYTFRRTGNELHFIVMTHEKPFIGDPYEIRPEMWPALNKGQSSHTEIYRDLHGVWISAYAPIFDSNGQISGIIDVDVEVSTFRRALSSRIRNLVIVSGIILLLGLVLSFFLSRRLVRDLRYLTEITERISLGQLDQGLHVQSADEVGKLAASLERMRTSLKMAVDYLSRQEKNRSGKNDQ